jgi:hypothetical protein
MKALTTKMTTMSTNDQAHYSHLLMIGELGTILVLRSIVDVAIQHFLHGTFSGGVFCLLIIGEAYVLLV